MATDLREEDADFWRQLAVAPRLFCGLDYDGTLAPIAPTPDLAEPFPGTRPLLERLAARRGVSLAIVTGRAIADVRRFLDLDTAYYVGIHGLELCRPGQAVTDSAAGRRARAILPQLAARLRAEIGAGDGLLLEEKGAALALHYRLAAPAAARRGVAALERQVAELRDAGEKLELLRGHAVVEVRPAGVDKGRALCELLESDAPDALPLYVGDDRTDEDAFAALPAAAVTVRVGPADVVTAARYRLPDPAAVHAFLAQLVERAGRG